MILNEGKCKYVEMLKVLICYILIMYKVKFSLRMKIDFIEL